MSERARVHNKSLPRRFVGCRRIAVAAAILAGAAAAEGVGAQLPVSELYNPALSTDAGNPPSFSRSGSNRANTPNRFRRILTDGNPPASGAGQSGFVSGAPPAGQNGLTSTPILGAASAELDSESAEPLGSSLPAEAAADDFDAPPPRLRRRRAESEDPYEPLGLRVGSFTVKPAVELSGGYDSNPERTTKARGGNLLIVAPELQLRSDWSRHELRADVRGQYRTYPGFDVMPSPDQPFVDSKVAGRIDVTRRTRIDLEGRFLLSTEDPNSPDLPAGLARLPVITTSGVTAGVAHRFNRLELGVSGSYDRTVYDSSSLTNGATVSNDDRNYNRYGVKLRGSYEVFPGVTPFVEVGTDRRIYDLPVDTLGFRRDSTGNEVRVGTTFELTRQLTGTASVGYAMRRYQDPALNDLRGLIADGSLVWSATPLTKVTFTARSQVVETTLTGVSGILRRDLGAQVDHSFRRWLIGTVKLEYGLDDYVGSSREDQRYAASAILTYKMSRNVQLKGEVRRQWLTSNAAGADYTANIFLLGLRLQ
ncbi:MAG: outer membrane beta-barrel protein [Rhizobiales bacterium]|nr:outer membrane beta-barrel protein [Hyphomicrobiales bacterium]